jgi:uncharacterized protein (UPF0548 family)
MASARRNVLEVPFEFVFKNSDSYAKRLLTGPLTYAEVGATKDPTSLPATYQLDTYSVIVGRGDQAFTCAKDALRLWQAHRHVGARMSPNNPPLVADTVVVITMHFGPFRVVAPCRIVYITDDVNRFGFAYGTLPGHPEVGEEAFHVQRDPDGVVTFDIVAFSRPASWLARLGKPVARAVQSRVTIRYLEGVKEYVTRQRSADA